jgi:tetratricopeptide (TPR) repeat protein
MTDARQGRGERDDHIAEVIPLRRSALAVDQPTSDLSGLVHRAGATLSEVVAVAEEHGLAVPERVRLAAVLLDARLTAAATLPPEVPASAPPPGGFEATHDSLQWADDLDRAVVALVELWRCHLNRREFLGAVAALAVTSDVALRWLVAPPDDAVERTTGSRRVGLTDIDGVRAMRHNLKAVDDAHGGGAALPLAVAYLRREVAPLLRGQFTDPIGRSLFSATAEFTLGVGWMAYDAGRHELAQRYMTQALRMSHAANNRAFGGRILAAISHQALHLGDVRHGIDLASAARTGTEGAVTPTVTAMLAAMEACAHATHGDTPRCLKALSEAERALGRSNPAEDPAWVDFDEGGLTGHIARSLRDLNRPREAERFARRSIEVCHPRHLRTRMQRYAILATTHVQQGDLEGACAVGRQVLEEARGLRSTRTLDDVTHLVQLVSACGPSASALEFTEQARALLKPGRRPPPASRS